MPGHLCEVIYRCYHLYFIHEENKAQRDEVTLHSWYVAQPGFKPEMGGPPSPSWITMGLQALGLPRMGPPFSPAPSSSGMVE